jgi:hypothetical protein
MIFLSIEYVQNVVVRNVMLPSPRVYFRQMGPFDLDADTLRQRTMTLY